MKHGINTTGSRWPNYFPDADNSLPKKAEILSPPTHKRSSSAEECSVHVRGSAAWLKQQALRNNHRENQSSLPEPVPAALGTQGESKRFPKWTPPEWSKERMRKAPDLDAMYGSAQPPRAKPGRASGIQKEERSTKDGMVKINAARIVLNRNITPNLPQLMNAVRQELQNGGVFKWTVSRNGQRMLAPYKLSDNIKQLALAALTQSEGADKAELMPGQGEFIEMIIGVIKQTALSDDESENKFLDRSAQTTALVDALKNKKLALGHPTLVGGLKEPEGRMGGELRYGKLRKEDSHPVFYINNDSGRYGEYEDRNMTMLMNIANHFEEALDVPVKAQWIDKPKAILKNKPMVPVEPDGSCITAPDASKEGSLVQDEIAAAANAALRRNASFGDNHREPLKTLPFTFNPEFLHLMESQTGTESKTLKWGTPELPRLKGGKSTIKFFEREGNVETGKPKINPERLFIDENQKTSPELIEALKNARNGGPTLVFGIDKDGHFVMAPQTLVPGVEREDEDGNIKEARLGHVALVGGKELRIAGEISMMPYEKNHPLYDPENPDKKRLVLINKSGRYGRSGIRTETHLLNVDNFLAKRGAKVDEVIFRQKLNDEIRDTPLLQRAIERP